MSTIPGNPLSPGTVLNGTVSWFGGPHDPTAGSTTASGKPVSAGGIAVYNSATLGGYWQLIFPNGHIVVEQQNDLGPAPWTGKTFDVAYSSLADAGYTEANFPTGASIKAIYLGKNNTLTTPAAPPTPTAPSGVEGTLVKGILYLAVIAGAMALMWYGSKTAIQPKQ